MSDRVDELNKDYELAIYKKAYEITLKEKCRLIDFQTSVKFGVITNYYPMYNLNINKAKMIIDGELDENQVMLDGQVVIPKECLQRGSVYNDN